jgi:hypothetical protein
MFVGASEKLDDLSVVMPFKRLPHVAYGLHNELISIGASNPDPELPMRAHCPHRESECDMH